MRRIKFCMLFVFTLALLGMLNGNTPPTVTNVSASQRTDGSKIVDIWYSVNDADNDTLTVLVAVSNDNGATFSVSPSPANLSGAIGENIFTGNNKHIIWNAGVEGIAFNGSQFRVKVTATEKINLSFGLVAYYPFNGNANDESGNGHDGTAIDVTFSTDRFQEPFHSVAMDGNGDYLIMPNTFVFHQPGDKAVNMWIQYNDLSGQALFWSRNDTNDTNRYNINWNGYGVSLDYRDPNGVVHIESQPVSMPSIMPNTWNMITLQRISNVYHYYLNGMLIDVRTDDYPQLPNFSGPWWIGKDWRSMQHELDFFGELDDIRLYDRTLSAQEIQALYHEGGWTGNP